MRAALIGGSFVDGSERAVRRVRAGFRGVPGRRRRVTVVRRGQAVVMRARVRARRLAPEHEREDGDEGERGGSADGLVHAHTHAGV